MGRYDDLTDRLFELVQEEHGGCEESTCDISCAIAHNFQLWAIEVFSSSGAGSDEFQKLYDKLPKKKFAKDAEAERVEMCKIETAQCPHCNAVTWEPEYVTDSKGYVFCGSCARRYPRPVQLHFDGDNLVDAGKASEVPTVAALSSDARALGPVFAASFEMLEELRSAAAVIEILTGKNVSQKEKKEYACRAKSRIETLIKKIDQAA